MVPPNSHVSRSTIPSRERSSRGGTEVTSTPSSVIRPASSS
ncbi:UNVERIFIED_ORG: hypothetical protein ABIB19_002156 [Arthrobacter sp. UYEF10]